MRTAFLLVAAAVSLTGGAAHAAETFDQAVSRATVDYTERLRQASTDLTQLRERIAKEKAPLLDAIHAAEDRIVAAEAEATHLETAADHFQQTRSDLTRLGQDVRKNLGYATTLAHDAVAAAREGMIPGEEQVWGDRLQSLQSGYDGVAPEQAPSVQTLNILLDRLEHALGGYAASGQAVLAGSNELASGKLVFVGPEAYFVPDGNAAPGAVRIREGSSINFDYPLPGWNRAEAEALASGKVGSIMADGSGGKALRLQETRGTVLQHIQKGGIVSYAIVAVGCLALLLMVGKAIDLWRLSVDRPSSVRRYLSVLALGPGAAPEEGLARLRPSVRELFAAGVAYLHEPKAMLEERLWAVLLRQRLHAERRLPLLSVIAVAAPLMGLLGTVTGMVRTFALITVFGTGNAGKLAGGISEVLISTELGLLVAIPTLVAHGFLANRIQKKLSLLERYALEFVTASQQRAATEVINA